MNILFETIVNAIFLSSVYILAAIGFALIFSILRVLNFAHGILYMVGAYVAFYVGILLKIDQWASVLISAITVGLFGIFLEKYFFRRFRGSFDRSLMVSLAIILILQTAADVTVGPKVMVMPPILSGTIKLGSVNLAGERIIAIVVSVFLLSAITFLIQKTVIGQEMLAVAQDPDSAVLQWININRITAFSFVLVSLAAVAGGLMGSIFIMHTYMGNLVLVKVIALVLIAGMGSIGGVFVSGLIIGSLDAILPIFIPGASSEVAAAVLVVIILLIRPRGLFGHEI
jgi:branched-chain amino acid transport system permease protein